METLKKYHVMIVYTDGLYVNARNLQANNTAQAIKLAMSERFTKQTDILSIHVVVEPKNEYQVWSEGYTVMEGSGKADLHGIGYGHSFADACVDLASRDARFKKYFDPKRLTYWGCRLFDSEQEARISFG